MSTNFFKKLLFLVLTLGVLVGTVFAVGAFAEDEAPAGQAHEELALFSKDEIESKIPAEYADPSAYPFVILDYDTKEFLGAYTRWGGETKSDGSEVGGALEGMDTLCKDSNDSKLYLYMRADFTDGPYYNFGGITGNHVIDLGGHKLTANNTNGLFYGESKHKTNKNPTLSIKIANGHIDVSSRNLIIIKSINSGYASVNNYLFDGVKITVKGDSEKYAAGRAFLVRDGAGDVETTNNITFRECSFVLSGARYISSIKTQYGLCQLGNAGSENHTINVFFEGGSAMVADKSTVPNLLSLMDSTMTNKNVYLVKGKQGYLSIDLSLTTDDKRVNDLDTYELYERDAETGELVKQDGIYRYYFDELVEGDTNKKIYRPLLMVGGYGVIPSEKREAAENAPIWIFDRDTGLLVSTALRLGGVTKPKLDENGNPVLDANGQAVNEYTQDSDPDSAYYYLKIKATSVDKHYVVYLNKDLDATDLFYDFGSSVVGDILLDFGDHNVTVTSGRPMLNLQIKANRGPLSVTFKGGTINIAGSNNTSALQFGSYRNVGDTTNIEGREINVTFIGTEFKIWRGTIVREEYARTQSITTNVNFIDCEVRVRKGYDSYLSVNDLFVLGKTKGQENSYSSITYQGGYIRYEDAFVSDIYRNSLGLDNKSFQFVPDENGKYTTIIVPESVDVSEKTYPTDKGNYYLRKTDSKKYDGVEANLYALSEHGFISTYLNLESDLNMIYRVFLPANANATVTFTVGGFEKEGILLGTDKNGLQHFKLPAINAALIAETITATLIAEDGSVLDTLDYTIEAYLEAVKAQNSDEATQNLVEALLVYGAAAEQYTGIDAEVGELEAIPKSAYTVEKTGTAISQFAMNINGTFFLRVGITLDAGTDMSAMKLVATKGDKVTTYDLSSYTAGNMIAITYDEITALELDENVTFVLMNGEEEISSIAFSANSYLFRAEAYAQTNPTLAALARAIYWYGVAAEAYKNA